MSKEDLEHRLRAMKQRLGVKEDTAVPPTAGKNSSPSTSNTSRKVWRSVPDDPMEQLWGAIGAVFGSWMAEKAVTYRRVEKITGLLGTASTSCRWCSEIPVIIPAPASVSRGTRAPAKDFLRRLPHQRAGEDVVAGIRTPVQLTELKKIMPRLMRNLKRFE